MVEALKISALVNEARGKVFHIERVKEGGRTKYNHVEGKGPGSYKTVLTYIITPGHGYFVVPLRKLVELKIHKKISNYSYMNATQAYLEEDSDAALDAGWGVNYASSHKNATFNSMGSYHPYWAKNPLKIESKVRLHNGEHATIIRKGRGRSAGWILQKEDGSLSRIPMSNPFPYILPPRE